MHVYIHTYIHTNISMYVHVYIHTYLEIFSVLLFLYCNQLSITVFHCTPLTGYQSLFAIFAGLLHPQLHHSLNFPFPLHFASSFFLCVCVCGNQVSSCLGHLLSPMCNAYPFHFNMLFSVLSRIVFFQFFFKFILSFSILGVHATPLQKFISVLHSFSINFSFNILVMVM